MHTTNADISIEEMTKIEGAASCNIKIRGGVVEECHFAITEMRRFFATAVRGKEISAVPPHVARICGTCSNAHLLASIKAIENGLGITATPQTKLLRNLLNYGLVIRDHALHLYIFSLPDVFGKNSILEFDENNPVEHALLDDCFSVKNAGNQLGILTGGRSVHAPFPRLGGTMKIPSLRDMHTVSDTLTEVRPKIVSLIKVFADCPFTLIQDVKFLASVDAGYTFLDGVIRTDDGSTINDADFMQRQERTQLPYSQASRYKMDGHVHMVGALARMNLNKNALHTKTKNDTAQYLDRFPSKNIFHNNLAQAIEMLHAVDASVDLIAQYQAIPETPPVITAEETTGIGIIEAPRGTLYHRYEIKPDKTVRRAKIIVPTGQNQSSIEHAIGDWVGKNLDKSQEEIEHWVEMIVRAYDPCMSCATHFLKLRIQNYE